MIVDTKNSSPRLTPWAFLFSQAGEINLWLDLAKAEIRCTDSKTHRHRGGVILHEAEE
nr:MAG TPA: hypothetical protein [Caudoviricetes sp.]